MLEYIKMLGIAGDVYWQNLDNWTESTESEKPQIQPAYAQEIRR